MVMWVALVGQYRMYGGRMTWLGRCDGSVELRTGELITTGGCRDREWLQGGNVRVQLEVRNIDHCA